jgi:hypothetical protein
MPKYLVYDRTNGTIVHMHETFDGTSGTSLGATRDEIMEFVDEALQRDDLEVLEVELERQSLAEGVLRVNPDTRELERQSTE